MILGMSLAAFTTLHVVIGLIGIASGFVVVFGMMAGKRLPAVTILFLVATALTSLTGFLFSLKSVTPAVILGILSILVLLVATIALYGRHLAGAWRGTYVISAIVALYFNFFVLIVQSFQKVPALNALAPTQSEAPFKIAQSLALLIFITLGRIAFKRFRPLLAQMA
jgi:hypothetical protein